MQDLLRMSSIARIGIELSLLPDTCIVRLDGGSLSSSWAVTRGVPPQ